MGTLGNVVHGYLAVKTGTHIKNTFPMRRCADRSRKYLGLVVGKNFS